MKWLLGLGVSDHDLGAIKFASWVRAREGLNSSVRAVHVVDPAVVKAARTRVSLDELRDDATAATRATLHAAGLAEDVEVILGEKPTVALAQATQTTGSDAVLVGRHATSTSHPIVRLGRVARTMIRTMHCATVVVAPDFDPDNAGEGLLLATDLHEHSTGAAKFAVELAGAMGLRITVVHVHLELLAQGMSYMRSASIDAMIPKLRAEARVAAAKWCAQHGLAQSQLIVHAGAAASGVLSVAEVVRPSLIVCGSRKAGIVERVLTSTVGSALASFASQPVAIVPADWKPRV